MNIATLGDDVETLLEDFVTQLKALSIPIPPLVFVGSGEIAWDGPLLAIHLVNMPPGEPNQPIGNPRVADEYNFNTALFVTLLRQVASIGPNSARSRTPSAKVMNAQGKASFNDAAALVLAAVEIFGAYQATTPGEGFRIVTVEPLGPQGGLAGSRLRVDVKVH